MKHEISRRNLSKRRAAACRRVPRGKKFVANVLWFTGKHRNVLYERSRSWWDRLPDGDMR
jgi:hypothetical protein